MSAYISMNLGFAYHQQKNLVKARGTLHTQHLDDHLIEHYQKYIKAYETHKWSEQAQTHDYASTLVNFAELLASEREVTVSISTIAQ